jgi:hypothetical protein
MLAFGHSYPAYQQLWYEAAEFCEQRYKTDAFRCYDNFAKQFPFISKRNTPLEKNITATPLLKEAVIRLLKENGKL